MFEHYLSNKNERATVAPKSKFRELNKGFVLAREHTSVVYRGFRNQDREDPVGSRINQVETFALWSS